MNFPKKVMDIINNPHKFIGSLQIANKDGRIVRFVPTKEQSKMLDLLLQGKDTVFLKPRQVGSSTLCSLYMFWKWFRAEGPEKYALLSKDATSAQEIYNMWNVAFDTLPEFLKREFKVRNSKQMTFKDTGAQLIVLSVNSPGGVRSHRLNGAHISELAFKENAEEFLSTIYAALNGNQLIVESTANYYNDAHHQLYMKAERGEANTINYFWPWFQQEEYQLPVPANFHLTEEEAEYKNHFSLTDEQMHWRRINMERNETKFAREYPATIEEAYAQLSSAFFPSDYLNRLNIIPVKAKQERTFIGGKNMGDTYAIGCDVASGRGQDYSTICVMSKLAFEPVALFRSNTISTEAFARVIQEYSVKYGNALVLVESNNWGLPVLNELRHLQMHRVWKDAAGKDWETTGKSKLIMLEGLRSAITEGYLKSVDNITMGELRSFILNEKGLAPHVPKNANHHGDMAIAYALAIQCLNSIRVKTFGNIFEEYEKKKKREAIRDRDYGLHGSRY